MTTESESNRRRGGRSGTVLPDLERGGSRRGSTVVAGDELLRAFDCGGTAERQLSPCEATDQMTNLGLRRCLLGRRGPPLVSQFGNLLVCLLLQQPGLFLFLLSRLSEGALQWGLWLRIEHGFLQLLQALHTKSHQRVNEQEVCQPHKAH